MSDYELAELAEFDWVPSHVQATDALVCFVPDGPRDPDVVTLWTTHRSRWYPEAGGTRVVVSLEGKPEYDATKWTLEKEAWDHEHCEYCGVSMAPKTPCWVTEHDIPIILCAACHARVAEALKAP